MIRQNSTGRVVEVLSCLCSLSLLSAQEASIEPIRPSAPIIRRPYLAPQVPPVRLDNSLRLRDLIRGGTLYLTVQDAIALALENNIDIEVARYGPILSAWQLERSEAGGALPGVPSSASQAGSVASGQGVAGSQAAAGVSGGGAGGGGGGGGNATISQVGPVTQTLDPAFQETSVFSHTTTPESNTVQSVLSILQSNTRVYSGSMQEGFLSGGSVNVSYSDHYLRENAPTDILNPSSSVSLAVSFQHNLLRGFGTAVGGRTIAVSKINLETSELTFRTQVIGTVVNVLNLYYGLVADYEDVKAKTSTLETARDFYQNNKRMEELGAVSPYDVDTAQGQVSSTQADLIVSQTNLRQQEVQLKNVLSRTGALDPVLVNVRVMPLDKIEVPATDDLPPLQDLVQKALAQRSDIAATKANVTTAEISALGTRNGVLPSLQVIGGESQAGLSGTRASSFANSYFVGGIGTALGEAFRRNFPTERIGAFLQAPIGNRQAQADFGIEQLQLRQTQLTTQKTLNQVAVDVSNNIVALGQARVRYQAAVQNRILQEQLLDAERKKFALGASTPYNVILQQRDLATAHSTETAAMVAYSNARIALDQALGATLETNRISIDDARSGKVQRESSLPAVLPAQP
jgi:outer membrane protein